MGDARFMRRAIELAREAEGAVSPRPPVGAVVVSSGEIVGEGRTHSGAGPHAEAEALTTAGERARGATLYVTLEPCSRSSVSTPCAQQVIDRGITNVVAAMRDPNPNVFGRGFRRLRAAGITVRTGVLRNQARPLIEPFGKWVRTGHPLVTLKLAATLDGKVAAPDGTSRWITGEQARAEVHDLRRRVDAVVVGSMTVVRDDPLLTYRLTGHATPQPLRVVIDGSGRTPTNAKVFNDEAPTLVVTSETIGDDHVDAWRSTGAEVVRVGAGEAGVDVRAVLDVLGTRGVCHALVEGGPTIAASFAERGLVDRLVLYLAPKILGGDAPGLFVAGAKTLTDAWKLLIEDVRRVGEDIRIDASPERN
jgi:diaminohydroxyphosphoribosylaminopyrimidine deaminase / 5-amino-6-(5-phosphoribosylamino)uracil reductase